MMNQSPYRTIAANYSDGYTDKGSKFIAYAFPVKNLVQFREYLLQVKKEHPKATHHCFAYRLGHHKDQFRAYDDGEPSGTAGRPILGQIDSLELTNVLVIVVRYFGGTLLGVSGLINAYRSAAAAALGKASIIFREITACYRIECDYTVLSEVMHLLKQERMTILEKNIALYCDLVVLVPADKKELLFQKLIALPDCTVKEWEVQ